MKVSADYWAAYEHHNPMEMHATTVVWEGGGKIRVHDKNQGVQNAQAYICGVFGLSKGDVHTVTPYVGGGFGSGLRPQYQLFLAVMATLELRRSVRVVLTRDQMFTHVYRANTFQTVRLGADRDGKLRSIQHHAVAGTSQFEDHQEVVVNWTGTLYDCENVTLTQKLAKLDTHTPGDMRAPGAPTGLFAAETAMDELAYAAGLDPVEVRLRNYTERDENANKGFTSKELRACYEVGAERFGWSRRNPAPRSMREGRELIGWGMATGAWEAQMMKTSARATLTADGKLEVACATADIGTGTYTILTQIGANAFGLRMEDVATKRDAAAGALGGLAGGLVLAAVMLLAERATGEPSDGMAMLRRGQWQIGVSHRREAAQPTLREEAVAEGGHLLLSTLLGGGFGVLRRGLGLSAQPAGLVLGLGFYPLAHWLAGPLPGPMRPPWRQQPVRLSRRIALHAVFGAVTALVADRLDRRLQRDGGRPQTDAVRKAGAGRSSPRCPRSVVPA